MCNYPGSPDRTVIPAKAGIQVFNLPSKEMLKNWIPAFAGMTTWVVTILFFFNFSALTAEEQSPLVFSAMGDGPYSPAGAQKLREDIDRFNAQDADSQFMLHLGDLKGYEPCVEAVYRDVATIFKTIKVPTFVTPGDNDWNDCANDQEAWGFWKTYFLTFEKNWKNAPTVERQKGRPENVAWAMNGVLLIGVHVVNGRIQDRLEWERRLHDNSNWINEQLMRHKENEETRAAVLFTHVSSMTKQAVFHAFNEQVETSARAFAKPILYLHGDGHRSESDRPWGGAPKDGHRSESDRPWGGAPNIVRVQVAEMALAPPLRVTVTMDKDPYKIYRFE